MSRSNLNNVLLLDWNETHVSHVPRCKFPGVDIINKHAMFIWSAELERFLLFLVAIRMPRNPYMCRMRSAMTWVMIAVVLWWKVSSMHLSRETTEAWNQIWRLSVWVMTNLAYFEDCLFGTKFENYVWIGTNLIYFEDFLWNCTFGFHSFFQFWDPCGFGVVSPWWSGSRYGVVKLYVIQNTLGL